MYRRFDLGRELVKIIAIVTMTIDHVGATIFPDHAFLRIIGRISFPLFCYLLVLGVESTRNIKNYAIRLFLFAVISQGSFYLALGYEPFEQLNAFFTLGFGLLSIIKPWLIIPSLVISELLNFDYGMYGILMIFFMYILRQDTAKGVFALLILNSIYLFTGNLQVFSLLALLIILIHVGNFLNTGWIDKGGKWLPAWKKYAYYVYYPFHLTAIFMVKTYILHL